MLPEALLERLPHTALSCQPRGRSLGTRRFQNASSRFREKTHPSPGHWLRARGTCWDLWGSRCRPRRGKGFIVWCSSKGQVSTHTSAAPRAQCHGLGSPWSVFHGGSSRIKHLSKATFLFIVTFAGVYGNGNQMTGPDRAPTKHK